MTHEAFDKVDQKLIVFAVLKTFYCVQTTDYY